MPASFPFCLSNKFSPLLNDGHSYLVNINKFLSSHSLLSKVCCFLAISMFFSNVSVTFLNESRYMLVLSLKSRFTSVSLQYRHLKNSSVISSSVNRFFRKSSLRQ